MATIKELADELGVSKTTIEKYRKLIPPTLCSKVGGKFVIEVGGVNLIKSMVFEKTANPKAQRVGAKVGGEVGGLVGALQSENEHLREHVKRLLDLLDHEQQLHLATKQELQLTYQKESVEIRLTAKERLTGKMKRSR